MATRLTNTAFTITVTQAASPAPIVDISGNGQFSVPACEVDASVVFSGNIYDCDLDGTNFDPADLTVAGADVEITILMKKRALFTSKLRATWLLAAIPSL